MKIFLLMLVFVSLTPQAWASQRRPSGPADCSDMETWDFSMGMCMPLAMAGMPMRMAMLHTNAFFMQTVEEGARGRSAFSVPDMWMGDIGTSVGDRQYVNLDVMGTFERWTFPSRGTPELLQIGETNSDGLPYLDAQHPHSSPIMGLTLSDTITLDSKKDDLKFWFAPRGQSTDGPIAFMHRPTGMVNPDAPLGHHIGQDVGHITSTVIGGSIHLGSNTLEMSGFNGTEPEPANVDLPIATPNSYAVRLTHEFSAHFYAMASVAYVKQPEPDEPDLDHVWRYSASIYNDAVLANGWNVHNALIWGLVNFYDHAAALNSFNEEFWVQKKSENIWGRIEVLQRTPGELDISTGDANKGRWVTAATLGYTHRIAQLGSVDVGLGASLTKDFLPDVYRVSYGGDPLTGKVFLQVGSLDMWDL